ncbi:hypothetical protein A3D03_00415 [Candidatus Gottesmanbacteria bacterium RIFCSPHIGHO2_02_FULL_40_13]|uniref:tRNA/rRNA methyltransferase SpoU type domain-containing protein n=1 Tax=Candidatus Gottesmanbacteria bacterium RIFCSPHIGHO2_02_FULL_40_13 TaxID=1798384 RepID=A0A1F6A7Z0_9BACT|nr:MAG: hypothetical protein A3D03_00415 [Candidatus Gottesmanbacteria bacterium RIFCSPHIGHO2_02_FULL_40_13]
MLKLNARQLRTTEPDREVVKGIKKNPIYIILDNVLDTYNVGAIFRLCDAAAARKIYLCGATETPPNPKIKKASVSTWKWVDWEYAETAVSAIARLKAQNSQLKTDSPQAEKFKIVAVEQGKGSIDIKNFKPTYPLALVVGNETYGVSQEVLKIVDEIVELPMFGVNKSLNCMVACGIVLYKILELKN